MRVPARRLTPIGCWAGLLIGLAAAAPAMAVPDITVGDVRAELTRGDAEAALRQANDRLATRPGDPQTRFIKANALAELGRTAEAIRVLDELATAYPQRVDVANNLGVLLARAGRLDEARERLAAAVADASTDRGEYAEIQRNLGDVYLALAGGAYARAGSAAAARRDGVYRLLPTLSRIDQPGPSPDTAIAEDGTLQTAARAVLARRAEGRAAGDLQAVLSTYSERYQPPGQQSRAEWLTGLRDALKAGPPEQARGIEDLAATADGPAQMRVRYRLAGDAPTADERRATLVREDGRWRIVAEG